MIRPSSILVVEDNPATLNMLRVTARGRANGRRIAGQIHLLLSDVVRPESEGAPLIDRLTAVRPGLRVLYMSGYADEAIVHHGVLEEDVAFLQKPFTPQALARKVHGVLDAPCPVRSV